MSESRAISPAMANAIRSQMLLVREPGSGNPLIAVIKLDKMIGRYASFFLLDRARRLEAAGIELDSDSLPDSDIQLLVDAGSVGGHCYAEARTGSRP